MLGCCHREISNAFKQQFHFTLGLTNNIAVPEYRLFSILPTIFTFFPATSYWIFSTSFGHYQAQSKHSINLPLFGFLTTVASVPHISLTPDP